jgi:hypothetical protein
MRVYACIWQLYLVPRSALTRAYSVTTHGFNNASERYAEAASDLCRQLPAARPGFLIWLSRSTNGHSRQFNLRSGLQCN